MDAAESQMCHAFAEPGGHGRTQKDTTAVEIEYRRTPEETGGHDIRRVRDREAPGSNPGPPTNFVFKIGDLSGCLESPAHRRITIFLERYIASRPSDMNSYCG